MTGPEDPNDQTSDSTTETNPTPESTWLPGDSTPEGWSGRPIPEPSQPGATIDPVTGQPVGRFIVSSERPDQGLGAQAMVEPVGGHTIAFPDEGSPDTHTTWANWSNYQRLNPEGHPEQKWESSVAPHGHYHAEGQGLGWEEPWQGETLDVDPATGNVSVVPSGGPGSGAAHQRLLGTPTGDQTFQQAYDAALARDKQNFDYQTWLRKNSGPGQARLDAEQQAQEHQAQDQQDGDQQDGDQQGADQQAPADGAEQTPGDQGGESGSADPGTGDPSAVDGTGDSADSVDYDNFGAGDWLQADDGSGVDNLADGGDSGSGAGDGQGNEGGGGDTSDGDTGDEDSIAMLSSYDDSWADSGDGGEYSGGDSGSADYSTADYSSGGGGDDGSDD
jgi:hypothetical protein